MFSRIINIMNANVNKMLENQDINAIYFSNINPNFYIFNQQNA